MIINIVGLLALHEGTNRYLHPFCLVSAGHSATPIDSCVSLEPWLSISKNTMSLSCSSLDISRIQPPGKSLHRNPARELSGSQRLRLSSSEADHGVKPWPPLPHCSSRGGVVYRNFLINKTVARREVALQPGALACSRHRPFSVDYNKP